MNRAPIATESRQGTDKPAMQQVETKETHGIAVMLFIVAQPAQKFNSRAENPKKEACSLILQK